MLNDEKMKVQMDSKEGIQTKIDEIKAWMDGEHNDPDDYDDKYKELEEVVKPIMDEMMKQNMPPGMSGGMPDMASGMPNVPEEPENEPKIEEID